MPGRFVLSSRSSCVTSIETLDQATQLDPHYAKAWARLGSAQHVKQSFHSFRCTNKQYIHFKALELWAESIEAWRTAMLHVSLPGLVSLRKRTSGSGLQFSEGLEKAEAALRRAKGSGREDAFLND
jgi:hypothetical protein